MAGRGDLILTPHGTWHDHGNDSTDPVIWMDVLDWPLMEFLDCIWLDEQFPGETTGKAPALLPNFGGTLPNDVFVEEQRDGSTALGARVRSRGAYLCGPMARVALHFDLLHPEIRDAATRAGVGERLCLRFGHAGEAHLGHRQEDQNEQEHADGHEHPDVSGGR